MYRSILQTLINLFNLQTMATPTLEIEKRIFTGVEMRASKNEEGARFIQGYGAVFDKRSEVLYDYWVGSFREIIDKSAFDGADMSDVRALRDHNPTQILGRTKAGTLSLQTDDTGLTYRNELPNTTYANDLWESMQRGDIDQSSFAFVVETDTWGTDGDGIPLRTITKISRVFDISPVTYPAYPDASSSTERNTVLSQRCIDHLKSIPKRENIESQSGAQARARALFLLNPNK